MALRELCEVFLPEDNIKHKSLGTISQLISLSAGLTIGLALVTVAISIFVVTGCIPIVSVIVPSIFTGIFGGNYAFDKYQHSFLEKGAWILSFRSKNEIAKNKMADSDDTNFSDLQAKINAKFQELGFNAEDIGRKEMGIEEFAHVDVEKQEAQRKGSLYINYELVQVLFMDEQGNFKDGILNNEFYNINSRRSNKESRQRNKESICKGRESGRRVAIKRKSKRSTER